MTSPTASGANACSARSRAVILLFLPSPSRKPAKQFMWTISSSPYVMCRLFPPGYLDATEHKIPELHRLKPSSQAGGAETRWAARSAPRRRAYTPLRSWTVRGPSAIVDSALAINQPRCAEATLFAEGPRLTDSYRRPGSWPHSLSHLAGPCVQARGASVPACARSGLSEDQEERYEGC